MFAVSRRPGHGMRVLLEVIFESSTRPSKIATLEPPLDGGGHFPSPREVQRIRQMFPLKRFVRRQLKRKSFGFPSNAMLAVMKSMPRLHRSQTKCSKRLKPELLPKNDKLHSHKPSLCMSISKPSTPLPLAFRPWFGVVEIAESSNLFEPNESWPLEKLQSTVFAKNVVKLEPCYDAQSAPTRWDSVPDAGSTCIRPGNELIMSHIRWCDTKPFKDTAVGPSAHVPAVPQARGNFSQAEDM